MGCGGCRSKKKSRCANKHKRLPSINPFFHFLKCVWRKFKGCKRSVVLKYAVKKWCKMSPTEKQPFFDAACKGQAALRAAKEKKNIFCKPSGKTKKRKSKSRKRKRKRQPKC